MRSSAEAMVAPVLPADTIAQALPSRTSSAARTSEESFFLRTLAGGVVVHGDDLGAGEDLEAQGVAEQVGHAHEDDREAEFVDGQRGRRR